jgi:hypothetical protein
MNDYWKLKAIALETELRLAQLQKSAAEIIERKREAFEAAGLDAQKKHKFDDEGETIDEDEEQSGRS